jgi:hypothetical protein
MFCIAFRLLAIAVSLWLFGFACPAFAQGPPNRIRIEYAQDAKRATIKQSSFANVHSLDAQRLYNVLCIAYGSNPKLFADIVEMKYLPEDRADGCEDEYKQVDYAMRTLFAPYIDPEQARKVRAEHWLESPSRKR